EQTDLVGSVACDEIAELLIGQRLQRRGVEGLTAALQSEPYTELTDDGFAGTRRRADENALSGRQCSIGVELEPIERERVSTRKGRFETHRGHASEPASRGRRARLTRDRSR